MQHLVPYTIPYARECLLDRNLILDYQYSEVRIPSAILTCFMSDVLAPGTLLLCGSERARKPSPEVRFNLSISCSADEHPNHSAIIRLLTRYTQSIAFYYHLQNCIYQCLIPFVVIQNTSFKLFYAIAFDSKSVLYTFYIRNLSIRSCHCKQSRIKKLNTQTLCAGLVASVF